MTFIDLPEENANVCEDDSLDMLFPHCLTLSHTVSHCLTLSHIVSHGGVYLSLSLVHLLCRKRHDYRIWKLSAQINMVGLAYMYIFGVLLKLLCFTYAIMYFYIKICIL